METEQRREISSAYKCVYVLGEEGKCESKTLKKKVLIGEPCGPPLVTGWDLKYELFITREKNLENRKNYWRKNHWVPSGQIFQEWHQKLLRDPEIEIWVNYLWLNRSLMWFSSSSRTSTVPWQGRKPNMLGERCFNHHVRLSYTMCTSVFLKLERRLVGL